MTMKTLRRIRRLRRRRKNLLRRSKSKKPMPKTKKAVAIPPDCEYKAGEYKEARLQYIAVKKDERRH